MVVIDRRQSYILTTAHNFFGVPPEDDTPEERDVSILERFLNETKCRILCATPLLLNSEHRVRLTNDFSMANNALVFFKVSTEPNDFYVK
jgi:hypothetical protein